MTEEEQLLEYLAKGGKLTSPEGAPARYRGEVMRLMATFVDSEMAGAAGFADCINNGPGIKERIAASRIVLEKLDHAERVLKIMGEFGANTSRYAVAHAWAARLERSADIGTSRRGGDMRLNVFHYPIKGWTDAVVMNVVQGRATTIQLEEFTCCSYQPLAEAFRVILPIETRHMELGEEGLRTIVDAGDTGTAKTSLDYWMPRVATSFGIAGSERFDMLKKFGLRHTSNEDLLKRWRSEMITLSQEFELAA